MIIITWFFGEGRFTFNQNAVDNLFSTRCIHPKAQIVFWIQDLHSNVLAISFLQGSEYSVSLKYLNLEHSVLYCGNSKWFLGIVLDGNTGSLKLGALPCDSRPVIQVTHLYWEVLSRQWRLPPKCMKKQWWNSKCCLWAVTIELVFQSSFLLSKSDHIQSFSDWHKIQADVLVWTLSQQHAGGTLQGFISVLSWSALWHVEASLRDTDSGCAGLWNEQASGVSAQGLSSWGCWTQYLQHATYLLHRVWDLSSLTRLEPAFPALLGGFLTPGKS